MRKEGRKKGEGGKKEGEKKETWLPTICSKPTSDGQHRFLPIRKKRKKNELF